VNAVFLCVFGFTFIKRPVMIFRFATLWDKTIKGSLAEKRVYRYCEKVNGVWCAFFVLNGAVASATVLSGNGKIWALYNGVLSYLLMGCLFGGEFIVRKKMDKKMPKTWGLSQFKADSRPNDTILCYDIKGGEDKTWRDFLIDTAKLRGFIASQKYGEWLLHAEDNWNFLVTLTAIIQYGKKITLAANTNEGFIEKISAGRPCALLTDDKIESALPEFSINEALNSATPAEAEINTTPAFVPSEVLINLWTSGTTGEPEVISQKLSNFETDNLNILHDWGEDWLCRRVASTVSPHHIWGFLFACLLPFTAGVPFNRRRIETPSELFALAKKHDCMVISVPAFMKRAAAEACGPLAAPATPPAPGERPAMPPNTVGSEFADIREHSHFIYESGGFMPPPFAKQIADIFGFWPIDIYGSTETSGIGWMQSKNGPFWTPFGNAQIWVNKDPARGIPGCLAVKSAYVPDPEGFVTGDLVDMLPDGRFILKGRVDEVVKIEEKRVSLTEMEGHIRDSGFARDVSVIPLIQKRENGTRQILGAAIVLNDKGKARFAGKERGEISAWFREFLEKYFEAVILPRKWRYPDSIPVNSQGKKTRAVVEAFFDRN
jgi:acyl-coenzyme A synthetase/AMP-(fatty) acid ligase